MKFVWENIYGNPQWEETARAKVYGGWLVSHTVKGPLDDVGGEPISTSITFVPDDRHLWKIDNE